MLRPMNMHGKIKFCTITCADGTSKVMQRDPSNQQPVQSDGHCYSLGMNACESHGGLKGVEYGIKKAQGKEKKK